MTVKTIRVSEKGQIAIPADMRESIGIEKVDELLIVQEGTKILIEPARGIIKEVKDDFSDLIKLSEKSLKKLWNNKADDIWDTYLEK